jgi:hypothetical protein
MQKKICATVFASALCLGLTAAPANAGSLSHVQSLSLTCNGSTLTQNYTVSGFPASSTQFIVGGAVTLTTNIERLRFLMLQGAAGGDKATILTMGPGETSARLTTPVSFQVKATTAGTVSLHLEWNCSSGSGKLTGYATVYFSG